MKGIRLKRQLYLYSVVLEFFLVLFYIYPIVPYASAPYAQFLLIKVPVICISIRHLCSLVYSPRCAIKGAYRV